MLLKLNESNPGILDQIGVTVPDLYAMLEIAEKEKETKKLTPEEKRSSDEKLWNDWLKSYRLAYNNNNAFDI